MTKEDLDHIEKEYQRIEANFKEGKPNGAADLHAFIQSDTVKKLIVEVRRCNKW